MGEKVASNVALVCIDALGMSVNNLFTFTFSLNVKIVKFMLGLQQKTDVCKGKTQKLEFILRHNSQTRERTNTKLHCDLQKGQLEFESPVMFLYSCTAGKMFEN